MESELEITGKIVILKPGALRRVVGSSWFRKFGLSVSGLGSRMLLQMLYFLLLSRGLGVEKYGLWVGVLAIYSMLAPFSSWGASHILIKHLADSQGNQSIRFGNSLVIVICGATLVSIIAIPVVWFLVPSVGLLSIVLLAVSELLSFKISEVVSQGLLAVDRMWLSVLTGTMPIAARVTGAGVVVISNFTSIEAWTTAHFVSTALAGLMTLKIAIRQFGKPKCNLGEIRDDLRVGGFFAASQASASVYSDLDKVMLVRMSSSESAGVYAAAHKVVTLGALPIRALTYATYPKFFKHGAKGLKHGVDYGKRVLLAGFGLALSSCVVIFLAAPYVPAVLGKEYSQAVPLIRVLSLIPIVQICHYVASDVLTGAGFQRLRTTIQIGSAVLNVTLNLWLIPLYGAWGAALSTLVVEAGMALTVWMLVFRKLRDSKQ